MILYSRSCAYAIRALTWLALRRPEGYLLAQTLGRETGLPRHFLVKILQQLVRRNLLVSARGRGGGFALSRPPSQITLLDIVEAIDGVQSVHQCVVGFARCDEQRPCSQHHRWHPICEQIDSFLMYTTLAQMSDALRRKLNQLEAAAPAEVVTR